MSVNRQTKFEIESIKKFEKMLIPSSHFNYFLKSQKLRFLGKMHHAVFSGQGRYEARNKTRLNELL